LVAVNSGIEVLVVAPLLSPPELMFALIIPNIGSGGKIFLTKLDNHDLDILISVAEKVGFDYVREGYLDEKLIEYGWRNYIFRLG